VTRTKRRIAVAVLSVILLTGAVWCFYLAIQCFDGGIMWVAIVSSNPHPSETAKVMAHYWMSKATNWFWSGVGLLALIPITFIINYWMSKRESSTIPGARG
jgi:NADH:ubiquinone oxidoreductase subunit 6 (subunit J)